MKVTFDLTLDDMNNINNCIIETIKQYEARDKTPEDKLKMNDLILLRQRLFEFYYTGCTNGIHYAI